MDGGGSEEEGFGAGTNSFTLAFNLARARARHEKDAGHRLTAAVWAGPMEGKEANQPVGLSLTCSRRGGAAWRQV